jgi:Thiamine pyrophosphate enzyme, N-terminal TPP binding domain
MTRTTGRPAFLSLLKDEGITHLFGNPGTTELPVMHALMDHPELTYVMAMQESLVVAMADGFSRASGKSYASRRAMAPHNASQPKCLHWPMSAPPPRSGDPKSIICANDRFAPQAVISQQVT